MEAAVSTGVNCNHANLLPLVSSFFEGRMIKKYNWRREENEIS